jgi:Ca2+-binding EF-hand superfamily protein
MSNARKALVNKAFQKLDKVSDGKITVEDLKGVYNVKKHPKFLSGEWNEDRCLREFLDSFDAPNEKDGEVKLHFEAYANLFMIQTLLDFFLADSACSATTSATQSPCLKD